MSFIPCGLSNVNLRRAGLTSPSVDTKQTERIELPARSMKRGTSGLSAEAALRQLATKLMNSLTGVASDDVRFTPESGPFSSLAFMSVYDPGCVKTNFEVQRRKINSRSLRSQQ